MSSRDQDYLYVIPGLGLPVCQILFQPGLTICCSSRDTCVTFSWRATCVPHNLGCLGHSIRAIFASLCFNQDHEPHCIIQLVIPVCHSIGLSVCHIISLDQGYLCATLPHIYCYPCDTQLGPCVSLFHPIKTTYVSLNQGCLQFSWPQLGLSFNQGPVPKVWATHVPLNQGYLYTSK